MKKEQSMFCAVGHNGQRIISLDGKQWTHEQTGKEGETYRAVYSGNGHIVAVGSYGGNNIFASTADGEKWESTTQDAKYSRYIRGIGFGNNKFIGLGGDPGAVGDSKPFIMTTTDGTQWSEPTSITGKNMLRRIAWGEGRFVAVGDRGRRASSTDALEWLDSPDVKAIDTLIDVAYGAGVFVGVGLHGLRMTSTDGITWTDRQTGEEGEHLNSIFWADNRFVTVGFGVTFTSTDGRMWQRHKNNSAPQTAVYGNDEFVGASWRGRILQSIDAVEWIEVHQTEHHVEALCFFNGK
ncbi:MAG: WD40/YVTN/BNR-like repeat-containing protein [Pirellulales bacterium]